MPISEKDLKCLLEDRFPGDKFEIKDLVGDQDHYELTIFSKNFDGIGRMQQHRYVMNGLSDYVGTKIHALSIKTKKYNEKK